MQRAERDNPGVVATDTRAVDPRDPLAARRLLEFLAARGLLDAAAIERAAAVQVETRQRIDVVISELGLLPTAQFFSVLSDYFGYPILAEADFPAVPVLEKELTSNFLRRNGLLPVELNGDTVIVATTDPFNTDALAAVAYLVDRPVAPRLMSAQSFA